MEQMNKKLNSLFVDMTLMMQIKNLEKMEPEEEKEQEEEDEDEE